MIEMVVSRQPKSNFLERHVHPPEIRPHRSKGTRITEVDEQPRRPRAHDPVVGGTIADVDDRDVRGLGHCDECAVARKSAVAPVTVSGVEEQDPETAVYSAR